MRLMYISLILMALLLVIATAHGQRLCPVDITNEEGAYLTEQVTCSGSSNTVSFRSDNPIPVVFHVVWHNAEENLSDIRLLSQLDALNRDFAGQNENLRNLPLRYRDAASDTDIRFCLATTNPDGEPEIGIVRVNTTDPEIAMRFDPGGRRLIHYSSMGGSDAWDPDQYINVWISPFGNLLGMATLPGLAPFPEEEGIIMDTDVIGTIDLKAQAEPYHRGHSLTHEMGHYLGLQHIWGPGNGSCETDDGIADTPDQALPYFGCPAIPQSSCGSEDFFMNFMDFTDDRCLAFFTAGQAEFMQSVLLSLRPGLMSSGMPCPATAGDTGTTLGDILKVRFDRDAQRVIMESDPISEAAIEVEMYAMNGQCILRDAFNYQYIFWLPSGHLAPGIYVVYFARENEHYATQIPIY